MNEAKTYTQTKGALLVLLSTLLLAALLAWSAVGARLAFAEEGQAAEAPAEAAPEVVAEQPAEATPAPEATPVAETQAQDPLNFDDNQAAPFGNDILWAGNEKEFVGQLVFNDLLAAGQNITVADSQVGGDIRLAGRIVAVTNTTVGQNMTLAAQDAHVTGGTANAVALAGQSVTFEGATNTLYLLGSEAYINGLVNGDVFVSAGNLRIGPSAQILGTIRGEVGKEPTVDPTAVVAASELKVSESAQGEQADGSSHRVKLPDWKAILFNILACVATAVIAEWIAGGHTKRAGDLLTEHLGAFIGLGVLWSILLPLVIVLLCVPVVTIPVAMAALFAFIALALVSTGFTAAALGRMLFPNAGRFLIVAIMGAIFGVLSVLPVASWVVRALSYVFTIGYVVISIREGQRQHGPDGGQPHLPYASTYTD